MNKDNDRPEELEAPVPAGYNLADALDRAADTLEREEVQYAMGLDHEHVVVQDYVDAVDAQGRTHRVLVEIDPDEASEEMDELIAEHTRFVAYLRAQAVQLRDGAGA